MSMVLISQQFGAIYHFVIYFKKSYLTKFSDITEEISRYHTVELNGRGAKF